MRRRKRPGGRREDPPAGLTLVEVMVAAVLLVVAITTLLGALMGQISGNEFSRGLAWATNDASRVLEQIRRQNTGGTCTTPDVTPPAGFATWDAWLADPGAAGGGGKSVQPDPAANELVVVSTQGAVPLTVVVAVCWRHRGRVIGDCTWNGAALAANPGVTESPAMLSTVMMCR